MSLSMNEKEQLKKRVSAKRKELEAKIERAQADGSKNANDAVERARQELDELKNTIKTGWDDLTEGVAGQINAWLDRHDQRKDAPN